MLASYAPIPLEADEFTSGMISSLRGVQLLIIGWWLCGASFQRAAVAREPK